MEINYLSDAKKWLRDVAAAPTDVGVVYTIAGAASALIALVERLDATAQDVASRVELASETVLNKRLDRLVEIERDIETVKRQQTANLDAVAALEDRWVRWAGDARIDERLENLERGKVTIGKGGEVVEMVDGAMADRITDVELTVSSAINNQASRIDEIERKLAGGHGLGVYGGPPVEAQPALWKKLENANADIERHQRQLALRDKQIDEAQLYARELEGKISKILDIARDSDERVVSFLAFKDDIIRATY